MQINFENEDAEAQTWMRNWDQVPRIGDHVYLGGIQRLVTSVYWEDAGFSGHDSKPMVTIYLVDAE